MREFWYSRGEDRSRVQNPLDRVGRRMGERPLASLRLYLLGRFEVVRDGAPVPAHAWRRRRPVDLLKLVALAPGRSLPRDQAIETLWPEKDLANGANNLHRALYDLRQILGGRWVDLERGALTLRGDVWVDVDAFEAAVRTGGREGWTHAVALYRGDLAPDDREAPWLETYREALRGRFVEAALPLARAAAAEGDAQLALPLLRRLVEADPAAEEPYRVLMRVLAEGGRRAEALRQYEMCELALRTSGLSPSQEARELRAAIQRGEIGPAQTRAALDGSRRAARRLLGTADPAPVRGRAPLLLLLESLVEQGSGAIVLLGERGVGKTRLAVEGARLAQGRGAAVLCGIGGTLPGAPYALFADAFRAEARVHPVFTDPLAAAAPAGIAGEAVRRAIFDGVEEALRTFAARRPIFLLLDDLDAADESSLNLLHFLARRAGELRLMVVATVCEEAIQGGTPIHTALAHLDCGRLARGVRVPRLSLAGTREQLADLLEGTVDESTVAHVYRITDGSPLLVEELVRAQRESGEAFPADADAAIRGRVARLGARAQALLGAAAVAGTRFDLEPVRLVCGLGAHEAVAALTACLQAKLVDEDGAGYRFHHALVRQVICDGLEAPRRAALHAGMADALESLAGADEPPSENIALHRRQAGQERHAIRHLVAAGHRAAARAGLREALAFYSSALELSDRELAPDGASRLEILDAAGRVQLALGDVAGAARSFGDAARLRGIAPHPPDPALCARARRLAALTRASAGELAQAHAEIAEGLAAADAAGGDGLAPLLHLEAQLLLHEGRFADALAAGEACARAAEQTGDVDLLARGKDLAALARAARGEDLARPMDSTGPAEVRRQDTAPEHLFDVHLVLWDHDLLDGGAPAVARVAGLLVERARMRNAPESVAAGRSGEAAAALAAGNADVAEEILRDALRGHRAAGSALGEALALERLAAALTVQGRLEEARDAADEAVVVAERAFLRHHVLTRIHTVQVRHRVAAGALHAAETALREASESAARHGACIACDVALRAEAVRVLLLRDRVAEAEAEVEQLERIARERGGAVLGVLGAIARLARARVFAARGHDAIALLALGEARAAFVAAGHRYEAARCARLEARLRGPGSPLPEDVRALDALVTVDADA